MTRLPEVTIKMQVHYLSKTRKISAYLFAVCLDLAPTKPVSALVDAFEKEPSV